MSFSIADYVHQLKALLPQGALWESLKTDVQFDLLLTSEAVEYFRINGRADLLINETDPRTVLELLTEWETFAGLPDFCVGQYITLQQRRNALHSRLTAQGGQSRQYFIDLAASLGFVITITEFLRHNVGMSVDQPINGLDWVYFWQVNAATETPIKLTVQGGVNEPLQIWGNAVLECMINRLKPAHTLVIFAYS